MKEVFFFFVVVVENSYAEDVVFHVIFVENDKNVFRLESNQIDVIYKTNKWIILCAF